MDGDMTKEPVCAVCDRAFSDHVRVTSHDFRHQKVEAPSSKDVVLRELKALSEQAYLAYISQTEKDLCLGEDIKMQQGKFTRANLNAHREAWEWLGRHRAYAEAARLLESFPDETSEAQTVYATLFHPNQLQALIQALPIRDGYTQWGRLHGMITRWLQTGDPNTATMPPEEPGAVRAGVSVKDPTPPQEIVLCAAMGPSGFICERPKGHPGRHYDGDNQRWSSENGSAPHTEG